MWNKFLKGTICVLAVVLLCSCLAAGWLYFREQAENSMDPDGEITILEQADGSLLLRWPEGMNAQRYRLEILQGEKLVHSLETAEHSCSLPALPSGPWTIRIGSVHDYLWTQRKGTQALEAKFTADTPALTDLTWNVDPETGIVTVTYEMEEGSLCTIFREDTGQILAQTGECEAKLDLDFEPVTLQFRVTRKEGNVTFYGYICADINLTAEDFLTEQLKVTWEDLGDNRFALSWNETKGDGYLVELSEDSGESWDALAEVAEDQPLYYATEQLPAFESIMIRVSAMDGAISDTVTLTTAQKVLYATIWPVQDLAVYDSSQGAEVIGTAPAGTAYCVLGESDGRFVIHYGDDVGYIDSNYCMINVAEYLGSLCSYDIPNSYCSLYRVHGIEIPDVTDTVILGYEDVMQADGTYLVPVLYPAAQKLLQAALAAREMGYRLKIYDSFRPYQATKDIYAKTEQILNEMTPDGDMTVQGLMTDDGRYRLGNFLAPVTSRHNYGVALDLTLEDLQMQTVMHDLSWFSALENNGENADLLQTIMVDAGFYTLQSEWWHFQDGEAFDSLKPQYLTGSVSAQCWVKDDIGWRYRLADGTFLMDCHQTIDGRSYEFDGNGYVA